MKTAHERLEAERLAKQTEATRLSRSTAEPELGPAGTPKRSGDSPERAWPRPTNAAIRILGNAPAADLSKRELFAVVIMAGLALNGQVRRDAGKAQSAVTMADELIAALDASRLD